MSEEKAGGVSAPPHVEWKRGAVLVMDALGVKGSWARSSPDELVASWRKVIVTTEKAVEGVRLFFSERSSLLKFSEKSSLVKPGTSGHLVGDCIFQAMSDTLVLVVQARLGEESLCVPLEWLAVIARVVFTVALKEGIYFRGVMSCGEFYGSPGEKLFIGPAVDEAVEWYTRPNWIGVSTAPSAFFTAEQARPSGAPDPFSDEALVKWNVPMHSGEAVESWAINWTARGYGNNPPDEKGLMALFAARPIGHDALAKYTNTLAFFRSRMTEQQKQAVSASSPVAARADS